MKKIKFSPLIKDSIRTIKKSFTRFLAIAIMTGLAAGVFIGLKSTGPNIKHSIKQRAIEHNMYDIKIASYSGIRDEDLSIIKSLPDRVEEDYVYTDDFNIINSKELVKLYGSNNKINKYEVLEGDLPKKPDEIALDQAVRGRYKIGDKISLKNKPKSKFSKDKKLNTSDFRVVGFVSSIDYLRIFRDNMSLAVTGADFFAYVKPEVFNSKNYSYALLKFKDLDEKDMTGSSYEKAELERINKVKESFKDRPLELLTSLKKDGREKILEGKNKIAEAKKEILDNENKLSKTEKDLEDGLKKLQEAKTSLDDNSAKLEKAKEDLTRARLDLDRGKEKYDKGLQEFKDKIKGPEKELAIGEEKLKKAKIDLDKGLKDYNEGLEKITLFESQLKEGFLKINQARESLPKTIKSLEETIGRLEAGIGEIDRGLADLEGAISQIETGLAGGQDPKKLYEEIIRLEEEIRVMEADPKADREELKKLKLRLSGLIAYKPGLEKYLGLLSKKKELEANKAGLEKNLIEARKGLRKAGEEYNKLDENTAILKEKELKLKDEKNRLSEGKVKLDKSKEEYEKAYSTFLNNKEKFQEEKERSYKQLNQAKKKLDDGEKDYETGLAKLRDGEKKYKDGLDQYEASLKKYEDGKAKYKEGRDTFSEKKEKALNDIAKAEEEISDKEKFLDNLKLPIYEVYGKYDNMVFFNYVDQANSLDNLAYIFTTMFYLVAILVTLTTVLRMVETERSQMGTLKALGYTGRNILSKFLFYGLSSASIGTGLGILFGFYTLRISIFKAYTSEVYIDMYDIFNPLYILIIFAITLSVIGLTIVLSVGKSLREKAAGLMRPKPPKKTKRLLLEKITFIWQSLSFLGKVSARNIFRHKLRIMLMILGVAGSFGLISMGFGIRYSVAGLSELQFEEIYNYDLELIYEPSLGNLDELKKLIGEKSKDKLNAISQKGHIIKDDGLSENIKILASDDKENFNKFIKLRDRSSKEDYRLDDTGVIISEKIAMVKRLKVGDSLEIKYNDGLIYSFPISHITEQYSGNMVYMSKNLFNRTVDPIQDNNSFIIQLNDDTNIDDFELLVRKNDSVLATININALKIGLDSLTSSLNSVIMLIILISSLLTFVILYNLTNINISERTREISTTKVLGFRPKELLSYVFSENLVLTIMGMFLGIGVGKMMHYIIIFTLSPSGYLFDPKMHILSYIYSALIISLFTVLVMVLSMREINKIDMVEALKSIE